MTDFLSQIRSRGAQQETPAQLARARANQLLGRIPGLKSQALRDAPHNWLTLECLANGRDYAKPDTVKKFVLWEARKTGAIHIEIGEGVQLAHPWVVRLFLPIGRVVRFPFNSADSSAAQSLSWSSIDPNLRQPGGRFFNMPRWSTASRSSIALVPENLRHLDSFDGWPGEEERQEIEAGNPPELKVHMREWADLEHAFAHPMDLIRFHRIVGDPGSAVGPAGIMLPTGKRYRMYSIKTGVNFVGSKYEGPPVANKHRLEANSAMAMLRSNVARGLANNDRTFGLQGELLTVTAPMRDGSRDGFQVRDLSCMRPRLRYLPGQAIPYARWAFDGRGDHAGQCEFWRKEFAVPLGRAKARLFLNYGLIHTSANAQNFVLGFAPIGRAMLMQFIVRDLGDTSWHDDYIRNHLRFFDRGTRVSRAFQDEAASDIRHILHDTSSGQYPAPEIVRLAVFSLITHGFGETLGWNRTLLYQFLTGVFDGFLSYIREVLAIPATYPQLPQQAPLNDGQILTAGDEGSYPHQTGSHAAYCLRVNHCLGLTAAELFERAAYVRSRAQHVIHSELTLRQAINAEELFLCTGVERLLRTADSAERSRLRTHLITAFNGEWPAVVED